MSLMTMIAAATIGIGPVDALPAQDTVSPNSSFELVQQRLLQGGEFMVTDEGCTYRRTQAPGYPARWILVYNPGYIGLPNSPKGCKAMI